MNPTRFFSQFGVTPAPAEGPFMYRMRGEFTLGVPYLDPNPLRARLYREWRRRVLGPPVHRRPVLTDRHPLYGTA
jgi:hypothetical protein